MWLPYFVLGVFTVLIYPFVIIEGVIKKIFGIKDQKKKPIMLPTTISLKEKKGEVTQIYVKQDSTMAKPVNQ